MIHVVLRREARPHEAASSWALLSKLSGGRAAAVCSSIYNTGTMTGVPSRVKRFSTAARICNSATCRSKSRAMARSPSNLK